MVTIFGKVYYIDFDAIIDKCTLETIPPEIEMNEDDEEEIISPGNEMEKLNIFKYELMKMCVETVLSEPSQTDEEMGELGMKDVTVSFKIAFNSLIKNEILIEHNDDE